MVSWLLWKDKKVTPKKFINADETRISLVGNLHDKVVGNAHKLMHAALAPFKGKAATWIPFFTAEGVMLFSMFVLPLDQHEECDVPIKDATHLIRGSSKVFYGFTKTGWSNGFIWRECIKQLIKEIGIRTPGIKSILYFLIA